MSKAILVNYNFTPSWLLESDYDYLIYDRSDSNEYLKDFPQERIIKTSNFGNVDYDKLTYLYENYDTLPDVFLWGKTNLFKYITPEEFEQVKNNQTFTPLLTQNHKNYSDEYGVVCYYQDGIYYERNNSWYTTQLPARIKTYGEFASLFHLPNPAYLPFAPGGNYILTKETVQKYGRDIYDKMRSLLPYTQNPAEAHYCERSYYNLWRQ